MSDCCHTPPPEPEKKPCCQTAPAPPKPAAAASCCHGGQDHAHPAAVKPAAGAKYFCPMCEGVVSDRPGDCPKCGMALERNPVWQAAAKTIYTCPMHPEIQQDHPGECPNSPAPPECI